MQNIERLYQKIPAKISDLEVINIMSANKIDRGIVFKLKMQTDIKDQVLSNWLDINVKTLRNYKANQKIKLGAKTQEHVILLLSLFKHGVDLFGSNKLFLQWLNSDNFHLDHEPPINFLNTISGIRFIEDRLTGIEHGDNA